MKPSGLAVFIPIRNGALTLPKLLDRLPGDIRKTASEIIVLDNHSTDGTEQVALAYRQIHQMQNMNVIRNSSILSSGFNHKMILRHCIDRGYTALVTIPGDGHHSMSCIPSLADPILQDACDFVAGAIMEGIPFYRYLGERTRVSVQNTLLGTRLSSFHPGYRAFALDVMRRLPFEKLSHDERFHTEIVILLKHHRKRLQERFLPASAVNPGFQLGQSSLSTTLGYYFHKKGLWRSPLWGYVLG